MFAEVDALPGAEKEGAMTDRDRQAASEQCRFDVGRHVVAAFERVFVVMRPVRNEFAQVPVQISTQAVQALCEAEVPICYFSSSRLVWESP